MAKMILVTGSDFVPRGVLDYLESEGVSVHHLPEDDLPAAELQRALQGMHGYLIGGREEPTSDIFERASSLEVVARPGTDFKAFIPGWKRGYELGIAFINTPGVNANSVAEFTLCLMVILLRRVGYRFESLRGPAPFRGSGTALRDLRLGVIGMGRIGARVAFIAQMAFGMQVTYASRTRHRDIESAIGVEWASLDGLLSSSDVVSLHRPGLQDDERPVIGQRELSLMKDEAVVINTIKWDLVDLDALYDALVRGKLRAAAFDGEGIGPAWDLLTGLSWDKFVWFPTTAYNTADANYRASMLAAQGIIDVFKGRSNPNVNNPNFREVRAMRQQH